MHADTEIKRLDVLDWAPPIGLHSNGQVVLMGDAFHLMSMCKLFPGDGIFCFLKIPRSLMFFFPSCFLALFRITLGSSE